VEIHASRPAYQETFSGEKAGMIAKTPDAMTVRRRTVKYVSGTFMHWTFDQAHGIAVRLQGQAVHCSRRQPPL
jgi:hypothetical protein